MRDELLGQVPCSTRDLITLPEADQRQLYDAFHLQVRYDHNRKRLALRVTINADTVGHLANTITDVVGTDGTTTGRSHVVGAPGGAHRTSARSEPASDQHILHVSAVVSL